MRKLRVFESVSLNGYFSGPGGDMKWAHEYSTEPELQEFVKRNASGAGTMIFGRITYEMMVSYWPTPMAQQHDPVVAKGMNEAEKYVFSRTLQSAGWSNTTLVKDDLIPYVRALKATPGNDLIVLGSGSIVTQLADARLVDEFQIVVKSVALASGRPLFEGVADRVPLVLMSAQPIGKQSVLLNYAAAG